MASSDILYITMVLQDFCQRGEIVTCGNVLKLGSLGHAPLGRHMRLFLVASDTTLMNKDNIIVVIYDS